MKRAFAPLALAAIILILAGTGNSRAAVATTELPTRAQKSSFLPEFNPYLPTYIGIVAGHSDDKNEGDLTFQFSIKYEIVENWEIYFAYTQKSFWAILEHSKPFRETNFSPEFFWQWKKTGLDWLPVVQISPYRHESTGEAGTGSRGWDTTYVEPTLKWGPLFIIPRLWVPSICQWFDEKNSAPDNRDIYRYYGYGNLTLSYEHGKSESETSKAIKHDLILGFAPRNDKISVAYSLNFPLHKLWKQLNPYLLLQLKNGYGGSLKNYNRETTSAVVGISFVP